MNIKYDDSAKRCSFVWCVTNVFEDMGFNIPATLMSEIIGDSMDDEWVSFLYYPDERYLDTCVRDKVSDIICDYFIGHPWPRYCDNIDVGNFESILKDKIERKVLTLVSE